MGSAINFKPTLEARMEMKNRNDIGFAARAGLIFAGLLLAAANVRATPPTPLLHYSFDDGSGAVPASDSGVAPQTNGLFNGSATRTTNTPTGTGYALDISTSGLNDYVHCGDPAKLNGSASLSNG